MSKKHLLILLVIYVVSAGASYATFSAMNSTTSVPTAVDTGTSDETDSTMLGSLLEIDPTEPKDQPCPLSGEMFTETEKNAWEQRRPLFVMIENAPDARPQSGLGKADVVFEAVAEGGVTRFGAIFYCAAQADDITLAPVRSARTYFIDWASGYNWPMYVHVGGANVDGPTDALGQINDYGWALENDINQFSVGYPTFVRDYNRIPGKEIATEHTMVSTTEKLWEVAEERDWTNMNPEIRIGRETLEESDWKDGYDGWVFEDESAPDGEVTQVSYDFWSGYSEYSVQWDYDSESKQFLRTMAGEKHVDMNDDEQIAVANVVVLFTTEKGPINEKKHMIYGTTGSDEVLIFKNGEAIGGTWKKKTRESELTFVDSKGNDIELARGPVWISVVSDDNEVEY